ncbi:GlmU family protein [Zeaxanthinibacter enoshimensis]|uniref:UDP-N-acetylglucosamine diphosphorylase/glucosamine-1-phosphate N-acetyltransferase n=1 Tax=Zeaxanthinibacter enoshimensis TaxID=392009 RepID=A0A4R6TJT0_9FLAO|nr:GlmU family protein [Zeaxanthinibacter enoshimensis]TDQ29436.1 UDP-N-acetylglucosamine diphosphorylase/glucosamine-1-phosphate N-acetyltransferase [Zeaxanthinibacter enoshimensis]
MNCILYDGPERGSLLPFTFTRPVCDVRIGILTIREKWEHRLKTGVSCHTEEYLAEKFPLKLQKDNLFINGGVLPDDQLLKALEDLETGQALSRDGERIAYRAEGIMPEEELEKLETIEFSSEYTRIRNTWDIFSLNGIALEADFEMLTKGRKSAAISSTNGLINPERIFLEEGARVEYCILNATEGPIYIGRDAEVMEGCNIRGGFALGEHGVVKMGAKIYGPTTAGPYCKIGGEISNSVLFGYSSKGHDGYLGNSVLGEWCNIGADSNTSNLKNNYAKVKLWNYNTGRFEQTGLQFCGLMMGDHSKSAIDTMFNTGTVVGVSTNIFSAGFPRNFVPSFSWGGASGFTTYQTSKAFETAKVVMARRNIDFSDMEARILQAVFEQTRKYRKDES